MPRAMYCLTDAGGHVYTKDGADSYTDVATEFGLDEYACRQSRWDLTNRRRFVDRELPANADTPSLAQIVDAVPDRRCRLTVWTPPIRNGLRPRGTFFACSRNQCEEDLP